jgi:hypothetical protein
MPEWPNQINRQTVALLTNYLLYHRPLLAVAIDEGFDTGNLAYSRQRARVTSVIRFASSASRLYISQPQPSVGFLCHIFRNRNSADNAPDQNSLRTPFEDSLLQVL